ncbi:MAG: cobalamin B12-binding domain-containing protein [Rhodomicrobium sp.]|nr:cobalamin B12-binding domain-containing protein [Rhodomicrobium sp.]
MVGSRYPHEAGGGETHEPASSRNLKALSDEVCSDRRYVNGTKTLSKGEQNLQQRLEHVVEGEIIPRLMLMNRRFHLSGNSAAAADALELGEHVEEFAQLILRQEAEIAATYLNVLRQQGVALDSLLLNLLAPTARRLGEMWEADTIDFVEVTIGVSRLQQLLHKLTFGVAGSEDKPGPRVLLLPTPSEQHTFGLLVVSEFFRREGWDVLGVPAMGRAEIEALVADHWFAIVGFSLSCERLLDHLRSTIESVRKHSKNRSVKIIVGGNVFSECADRMHKVGADMVASDAKDALAIAQSVLNEASVNARQS